MANHVIDTEWDRIIQNRSDEAIPDDFEFDKTLVSEWDTGGYAPKGCSLHPGCHKHPERPNWRCKIYLVGQQRVIGIGSCYQMAKLYDYARFFFAKYRTAKETFGGMTYNFGEENAKLDIAENLFLKAYLETMEYKLLERGELRTAEQRAEDVALRKKDYQSRYTTAGQLKHTQEQIFDQVETLTIGLEKVLAIVEQLSKQVGDMANRQAVAQLHQALPSQPCAPGYTAPYIGDPIDLPVLTCKNISADSAGHLQPGVQ